MSKVLITPTKDGALVTPYAGNADFGYIMLAQTKSTFSNGWLREQTNRTIIKGSVESLENFVNGTPDLELPGNLVVKEFVEGNVPEAIAKAHFDENLSYEEQIEGYIKRAGSEGPALMVGDKRILRFTIWDMTGEENDVTIQHSNSDEVKAYNATKETAEKADL
jgi:hypothetical protein